MQYDKKLEEVVDALLTTEPPLYHGSIRDPIHGYIPTSEAEQGVINTREFQRLRDVDQLGCASFVFVGARGKRFEHSIGVGHLSRCYCEHFLQHPGITEDVLKSWLEHPLEGSITTAMFLAGLLHDIAHGPWSHTFDEKGWSLIYPGVEKGHDVARKKVIRFPRLVAALAKAGVTPENIIDLWETAPFSTAISGPFGADRMDYMARDKASTGMYHTGHGDWRRIIQKSVLVDKQLRYHEKLRSELLLFLGSREYMYSEVYRRPQVTRFEGLVKRMISKLIKEDTSFLSDIQSPKNFWLFTQTYFFARYISAFGESDPDYQAYWGREKTWLNELESANELVQIEPVKKKKRKVGNGEVANVAKKSKTKEDL